MRFHLPRRRQRGVIALCTAALLSFASTALAATNPYLGVGSGFDVSYPQCDKPDPSGSFGIVGVTGGKAFTSNTCFEAEYAGVRAGQASIYMNLNAAVGSTAGNGLTGPYTSSGSCSHGDKTCQAYNYGWNAAQHAYRLAGAHSASTWWLDIETANSWQAQTALNQSTIQGAVDFLLNRASPSGATNPQPTVGISNVGIYSSPSMWQKITGGWKPDLPVWYAGTSATGCANASGFTGGPLWLVQQASGVAGGDIAC
jgi:hypothetical protein